MGFNLDFEVKDNLTDSQKKYLRDQFLKHFGREEDLSTLRGFYIINPFEGDTISYKSTQDSSSMSHLVDGK